MRVSLTVAVLAAAVHVLVHFGLTVEDAGITYSYARTFADGHGLGHIFENAPKAEGYSNFLWLVAMAPLGALTTMETASKALGLAFGVGTVFVVHRLVWHLARDRRVVWGVVASGLVAPTAMWAAAGLENGLYVFLVSASALLFVREEAALEEGRQPLPGSAALLVLVAMTRPEGFMYGGAVGLCKLFSLWRRRHDLRRGISDLVMWSLVLLFGVGAYHLWHYSTYHELVPSTVIAKSVTPTMKGDFGNLVDFGSEGWWYATELFRSHGGLFILPAAVVGAVVAARSRAVVVVVLAVVSLVLPLYSPDWMPQLRFMFAFPTLLVVLAVLGIDALLAWARGFRTTSLYPAAAGLATLPLLALVLFAAENLRVTSDHVGHDYPHFLPMRFANESYAPLREVARTFGLDDPFYVLPDVGGSTYLGRMRIVDSLGLADLHVARSHWDRAILEQYFFVERRSELVSTHEPWTSLTGIPEMSSVQQDYVRLPSESHAQFVRRDVIVSPSLDVSSDPGVVARSPLVGWSGADSAGPDEEYALDLYWGHGTVPSDKATYDVSIIDAAGVAVRHEAGTVGYPWFPMSRTSPGEALRTHVVLPAPVLRGAYTVEILFRAEVGAPGRMVARRHLQVGRPQASAEAADRADRAVAAARRADMAEASRLLRLGSFAAGSDAAAKAEVDRARAAAAGAAFAAAETGWRSKDRAELLDAVRVAADLRRRLPITQAEHRFARVLRAAAEGGDSAAAYELLVAAAMVDPTDGNVQKRLEHARRVYLRSLDA
ncbi:MAG TPA: hypothetical protein VM938_08695 [Acidimicrobiales bacterium]|nr:hypothetical protein [Acidimicrobiales bacterium]